jgi:hypothetical protein
MRMLLALALSLLPAASGWAQSDGAHAASPYAGQEKRAIKSLSQEDIAELRKGAGWGLAKAAELNGLPGPAHLLELKDEIPLTAEQVTAIEALYARMKEDAVAEGERLIALEGRLDELFRDRKATDDSLRQMLTKIEESRGALRYIHLATHLATPPLLTDDQIDRYNRLRGYDSDPCDAVPAGHDPAMWRKHNGCD